jgi:hypothetical protein
MKTRVKLYVAAVCLAAVGATWLLAVAAPVFDLALFEAALGFVLLGLVCHAYMFQHGRGAAAGSIAFIPFLTALTLHPHWATAVFVAVVVAVVEALRRASPIKAAFNVAQHLSGASAATFAYVRLGGTSLHESELFRPVPYFALVLVFFFVTLSAVSGVLALSSGRRWLDTWSQTILASLKYDLMSIPVIYMFAMIYNRFAIAGVLFLAVLLLGARQLYRTNRQLESANQELLEVIVAAIEMRDPYTSGHSQRVAEYSKIIARAIGLSAREIQRIGVAALLHDVGKIDQQFAAILQKPGRLTDEERRVIELHPIKSEELVAMVSSLADLLPAIRHHHERWDGKGYPDRLQGAAIPLASRIITFADTIDAMTTDRPYRPALGADDVRSEIQRNRGTQFDPELCDKLLASPQFLDLFKAFPSSSPSYERMLAEPHIAA